MGLNPKIRRMSVKEILRRLRKTPSLKSLKTKGPVAGDKGVLYPSKTKESIAKDLKPTKYLKQRKKILRKEYDFDREEIKEVLGALEDKEKSNRVVMSEVGKVVKKMGGYISDERLKRIEEYVKNEDFF